MSRFVLGLDQGTTGSTAMLYDVDKNEVIASANHEFTQHYPKPSWVEHDLNEIWTSIQKAIETVFEKTGINKENIISIGITNQRETTCLFDNDGKPLAKAIVWQDRRTSEYCDEKREAYTDLQNKTGLPLDPYFSGTKLRWLLNEHKPNLKNTKFGTIDTFLLYKLTNNKSHATEPSNASRTLLLNLETTNWDEELLSFFEIPKEILPEIKNTFDNYGKTEGLDFLPDGIPISCLFGDQQAALFGQACLESGELKCTYGTGAFLLLNTGSEIKKSNNGLLTTIAYQSKEKTVYALEGSTYIAGAAVQFLRDNFKFIKSAPEIEDFATQATHEQMKHLFLFPFFTGIGSPYWNANAKACLYGLTRDTGIEQVSRACLEGITLSINDLVNAFEKDLGSSIGDIRVDGGAVKNNYLMQLQSNFSKKNIVKPAIIETTALGSILGSLIGVGEVSEEDIKKLWRADKNYKPKFTDITEENYFTSKASKWTELIEKIF